MLFGMLFIGLTFILLLWFTRRANQPANRVLAMAVAIVVLWLARVLAIGIQLAAYVPFWSRLPMQFSLVLGPLLFFYVLKITRPDYKFVRADLLHFCPLLLQQGVFVFEIWQSIKTGAETFNTTVFQQLNPVLQLLAFISVIIYLYRCRTLIENFYRRLKFNGGDRYRRELRWLRNSLTGFGLVWLLWIAVVAIHPGLQADYWMYLLLGAMIIWIAAGAFSRPEVTVLKDLPSFLKSPVPAELREKGAWLKNVVRENRYYEDPELSLGSLAEKLELHTHELSRILNAVLKKSFNDFISEYRVKAVIRKMLDPAYDHITLLGIAFESGFNSQSAFTRIFKNITGNTPLEYKIKAKKGCPPYKLGSHPSFAGVISNQKLNRNFMFKNYFKIAWRNLIKNKASSAINIGGLAVGMAVAILIGLWIWDEVSYDTYHHNYDSLGQVMTTQTSNNQTVTFGSTVVPLGNELGSKYGNSFKLTALTSGGPHILAAGETKISQQGMWAEPSLPAMLSLVMVKGSYNNFQDPTSILVSASTANALFGSDDPIGKVVRIDNNKDMKVTGVYIDLPGNTTLSDTKYMLPWSSTANFWSTQTTRWDNHGVQLYVQLNPGVDFDKVSAQIKNITTPYNKNISETIQVFPMSKWHLYSDFKNGRSAGGRIRFVRLFGIIGFFVLLLACINFMNLSTARSEKKAKEVGIRKAIGSMRTQLIGQFLSESMLVVFIASVLTVLLVWYAIPYFNSIAGKQIAMPWANPFFWLSLLGFTFFTGLISGSYPAFYLSDFKPVQVLKGTINVGRSASLPRKALVVVQFTVSFILIIGTIVVFRQIQFAANRSAGYAREGLITVEMNTPQIYGHYGPMRNDLIQSGAALDMSESSSATTDIYSSNNGFTWEGKAPGFDPVFGDVFCSPDFGKTIGWQIVEGRDFSGSIPSDTGAFILNESALKLTGIKKPIGKIMHWNGKDHVITGVVKDMIMTSPYKQTVATIFQMKPEWVKHITIRLNPNVPVHAALTKIAGVFKKYDPASPFEYKFNDDEYAKKFSDERQIGQLATAFAVLAIFISCLGLFGMASFVAEQRTKEIGVRKVLGATVFTIWQLLSKDFIVLIAISTLVATPVAYYFMHSWLQGYDYRTEITWWIFAATAAGTLLLTLATVSYQSITAALANPVKSLKTE